MYLKLCLDVIKKIKPMIKTYDKTSMNKHYRKLGGVLSIQNTQFQKKIWSEETISNPSFSTYKFHDLRHVIIQPLGISLWVPISGANNTYLYVKHLTHAWLSRRNSGKASSPHNTLVCTSKHSSSFGNPKGKMNPQLPICGSK